MEYFQETKTLNSDSQRALQCYINNQQNGPWKLGEKNTFIVFCSVLNS